MAGPPPAIAVLAPAAIAKLTPPPRAIVSAARPHLHRPQLARAPPAA
jgi:hypothetical protein